MRTIYKGNYYTGTAMKFIDFTHTGSVYVQNINKRNSTHVLALLFYTYKYTQRAHLLVEWISAH